MGITSVSYKVTPDELYDNLCTCLMANLVVMISGAPGIGKSEIVKQLAKDNNLKLIDIRLSTIEPTDLTGLPNFIKTEKGMKASYVPFDMFPLEDTDLGNYNGFLIFMDEMNAAPRNVQASAYRILLDREIGQFKLHPKCYIICAGNRMQDRAITTELSSAMTSRLVNLELTVNLDQWLTNVGFPRKVDPKILGFLKAYPDKFNTFDPDIPEKPYCCPRTWIFADKLIKQIQKNDKVSNKHLPLLSGVISEDIAVSFIAWVEVYSKLPTIDDILKDPEGQRLPDSIIKRWAMICSVMENANEKNIGKLVIYADKFPVDFKIMFVKNMNKLHPEFRKIPDWNQYEKKFAKDTAGYLINVA